MIARNVNSTALVPNPVSKASLHATQSQLQIFTACSLMHRMARICCYRAHAGRIDTVIDSVSLRLL